MSDLSKVYDKLKTQDVRYNYQFDVSIVGANAGSVDTNLKFYAISTSKPAMTINTGEINYQGFTYRVPNNLTFDGTWSVTVRASQDMKLYEDFVAWSKIFADYDKGGGGKKNIPDSNGVIDLMDQELNTIVKTYTMYGLFPTEVGELTTDHSDTSVSQFNVTFAYQFWK